MKIFCYEYNGHYGGGLYFVYARDKREADLMTNSRYEPLLKYKCTWKELETEIKKEKRRNYTSYE